MPARLSIRDATPADAAALAALYNAAIRSGAVMREGRPRSEATFRALLEGLGEWEACLLLEQEGAVAGWGVVRRYSDRAGYRFCGETFVYVQPALRRRGYGAQIQHALVERCKAFGYHHLLARIWAVNAASRTFHEQSGYEVVGIQREIGSMHGHWLDLVVLQRVLDEREPDARNVTQGEDD